MAGARAGYRRVVERADDRVLVLRALGLGDLLVAVPAVRAVRRHRPAGRVVLATPAALAPLARWTAAVDEVLPTDRPEALRWPHPDPPSLVVNLHGTGPQSHRALDALRPGRRVGYRAAGWVGPDPDVIAARHPHERERWCALLSGCGIPADPADLHLSPPPVADGEPPVLVHPGAQFGSKRWPADRFAEVAAALDRAGRRVLLTGSAAERDLARHVGQRAGLPAGHLVAGRTDVAQLAALVARAGLLICGDTGVAHLASAFGTPSVVLFGPADPARWGPPAGPHTLLTDAAVRRGAAFADDPDPALLAVTVPDVLAAVAGVFERSRVTPRAGPGTTAVSP